MNNRFQYILLFFTMLLIVMQLSAQEKYAISGVVKDDLLSPLPGASVNINNKQYLVSTNKNGYFIVSNLHSGKYEIEISFLGFKSYVDVVVVEQSVELAIVLNPSFQNLHEVLVIDHFAEARKREEPLNVEIVNSEFLRQNMGGSLMNTLERLPGISSIDIGSGQSKPVIRGLSFNRVSVVENGIKHEGQQWGADHGVEIDQFAVGRVEVIKGPSSLRYGSDAIGGVIDIKQTEPPMPDTFGGTIDLVGKSNNNLAGTSVYLYYRKNNFFISGRGTLLDFADYKVPTDSVDIYSYRAALHENRLRNTAGKERNHHLTAGYINTNFSSKLFISTINSTTGFFANAHGLEPRRIDTELHDKSDRDIQYPYQTVSHFKIINRNRWVMRKMEWLAEFGFQNNFRQEWSQYVNHGYMPPIFDETLPFSSDLERSFDKQIFSGNLKNTFQINDKLKATVGLNAEYQHNETDGRGFIIPGFDQVTTGTFFYLKHDLSEKTMLHAGIRYDLGNIKTQSYHDWFQSPETNGSDTVWTHLQRVIALDRNFSNFTWSVGLNHNIEHWSVKANAGKSFRMPIAKELAANGVNYHYFSYEVGDPELDLEVAYQFDAGVEWHTKTLAIELTPFLNYFTNYIYLNPTAAHDRLYGNGHQVFNYSQSEVLMFGTEIHTHVQLTRLLKAGLIGNYLFSQQLSGDKKGFTLPFSPPASFLFHIKYSKMRIWVVDYPYLSADIKLVSTQNRIVPPENKTPGYQSINMGLGGKLNIGSSAISFALQAHNILNSKFYNHTSFYRLINVPEQGRNFVLNITIPLSRKIINDQK